MACRVAARTAGNPSRLTSGSTIPSGVSPGWMTRAVRPSVQADADTRSDAERVSWCVQSPDLELVLNQPVGGLGVGHAQQCLGQHHQRQTFLGGQRISVQEILYPAEAHRCGRELPRPGVSRGHRCAPRRHPSDWRPPGEPSQWSRPAERKGPAAAECRAQACWPSPAASTESPNLPQVYPKYVFLVFGIGDPRLRRAAALVITSQIVRRLRAHVLPFAASCPLLSLWQDKRRTRGREKGNRMMRAHHAGRWAWVALLPAAMLMTGAMAAETTVRFYARFQN